MVIVPVTTVRWAEVMTFAERDRQFVAAGDGNE
jgi:hypothetical protein